MHHIQCLLRHTYRVSSHCNTLHHLYLFTLCCLRTVHQLSGEKIQVKSFATSFFFVLFFKITNICRARCVARVAFSFSRVFTLAPWGILVNLKAELISFFSVIVVAVAAADTLRWSEGFWESGDIHSVAAVQPPPWRYVCQVLGAVMPATKPCSSCFGVTKWFQLKLHVLFTEAGVVQVKHEGVWSQKWRAEPWIALSRVCSDKHWDLLPLLFWPGD